MLFCDKHTGNLSILMVVRACLDKEETEISNSKSSTCIRILILITGEHFLFPYFCSVNTTFSMGIYVPSDITIFPTKF